MPAADSAVNDVPGDQPQNEAVEEPAAITEESVAPDTEDKAEETAE